MNARILVLLSLIAALALFPSFVAGGMLPSAVSGLLTFVEAQFDIGLDGSSSVAVSPDGDHVYVTGYWDDAVAVFSRDEATGALAFVEMEQDGVGGTDGLNGARSVAVSPDGGHVYVASDYDQAVAAFSRDGATGALTFVEREKDGIGGVDGLGWARSVAVSPDGGHVYVAGYGDDAVAVFSRDGATGALTFVEMQQDGVGGVDGLDGASSVAVSPGGGHVYVASCNDDAVAVFDRDDATGGLSYVGMVKDGVGGVDGLRQAWSVAVSLDGGHVYVTGGTDNAVAVFGRNGATGALTFVEREKDGVGGVDGLRQAWSVAVSPDGGHVYVAGHDDDAVAAFSRDGATGALTFVQVRSSVDGLAGAVSIACSPDGRSVYVAGNDDDAVVVFSRDDATGALTYREVQDVVDPGVAGLQAARSVAVSPDGGHVYVVGHEDDAVAVFSRDGATGALTFVEVHYDDVGGVDGLNGGQSVAVSPDGGHVYVAAYVDDAVAVFSRDGATGALTFVEVQRDDTSGVDGLNGAYSIAFGPGGDQVYVAGYDDDAVAIFSRDRATGALSYLGMVKDGEGGVDGLNGANSVAVSPGGSHVYVASRHDCALAVFSRGSTGALTYVEMQRDGVDGVDGLNGARSVVISPRGSHVFVVGQWDDALAVFSRNGATGALTFMEVVKDSDPGVDGLDVADGVAVSPDGRHVYVAGYGDDAVAVFDCQFTCYLPLVMRGY